MTEATARVSRTMNAPVQDIWDTLTDPQKVGALFMGSKVETDFRVGSPITFKGEAYEDKGEILDVKESRRLSFSHYSGMSGAPDRPENYHVVSWSRSARPPA